MDKRLISENLETGTRQYWHEHDDGSVTVQTTQQVDDVIDANRGSFNQVDERAGWKGDMHRVASIPMSVYYHLKAQGIIDDPVALKKWLNDPDNRFFRTRPGVV